MFSSEKPKHNHLRLFQPPKSHLSVFILETNPFVKTRNKSREERKIEVLSLSSLMVFEHLFFLFPISNHGNQLVALRFIAATCVGAAAKNNNVWLLGDISLMMF